MSERRSAGPPDAAPNDRAAALLRRVARPRLSRLQLARVKARLLSEIGSSRAKSSGRWMIAAVAAALLLGVGIGARFWPRAERTLAVTVPPCTVRSLVGARGAQVVLVGPGVAEVGETDRIALHAGTLVARTGTEELHVQSGVTEVRLGPRSTAEITLESSRLVVAAYAGKAEVRWSERSLVTEIEAGHAASADGAIAIAVDRAPQIERWLAGSSEALCAPAVPSPPIARAVPAAPALPAAEDATVTPIEDRQPSPRTPRNSRTIVDEHPHAQPLELEQPKDPPGIDPREDEPGDEPLPAEPPADPPVVRESKLVANVIERLRTAHDPLGALRLLDRHAREFQNPTLGSEVTALRLEALLAAGQSAAALAILDGLNLDAAPRGATLRVLRGELRAKAGRCAAALADWARAENEVDTAARDRIERGRLHCAPATTR